MTGLRVSAEDSHVTAKPSRTERSKGLDAHTPNPPPVPPGR